MHVSGQPTWGVARLRSDALENLRASSVCLIVMGIALVAIGTAAIGSSLIATTATVSVFGVLLLVAAIVQVATAFWGRQWRGFVVHLLAGILYLIAGIFMIDRPFEAAVGLTLVVAACLLVSGILRVILSIAERFDAWGWVLVSGVVSIALGASIWRQWPVSGLWVIGLLFGIDMLLSGLSWVMLGFTVRATARTTAMN